VIVEQAVTIMLLGVGQSIETEKMARCESTEMVESMVGSQTSLLEE